MNNATVVRGIISQFALSSEVTEEMKINKLVAITELQHCNILAMVNSENRKNAFKIVQCTNTTILTYYYY